MAETKVISKDTANRTTDKPADLSGGGYLPNGIPQTGGAWGANWGTPPAAMQQPNMLGNINLTERYTAGNVIRVRDGDYYKVVGETSVTKNTKGLSKVKGRDGKYYYMKKLSSKEIKTLGKNATKLPSVSQAPVQSGPPANVGFQQTDNWWTTDWWNRPGYYKRMY